MFGFFEDHPQTTTFERYAGLSQQSQRIIQRPGKTGDHCRFDFPCRDTQAISGVPVCVMLERSTHIITIADFPFAGVHRDQRLAVLIDDTGSVRPVGQGGEMC
ncbi:MAG: hypothetical protein M0R03_11875 [Novosphingobium sp.]|nr:hypothetical protein [Novosphingobium sp.]